MPAQRPSGESARPPPSRTCVARIVGKEEPTTLEEAASMSGKKRVIPIYESNGTTQIGVFFIGGGSDREENRCHRPILRAGRAGCPAIRQRRPGRPQRHLHLVSAAASR